ncbi:hypothetical protein CON35_26275 [Bacillus cereus]|nr:hypothetical protein CON35_26275 [Bacillus cereus]
MNRLIIVKWIIKNVIILWNIAYILIATSCDYNEVYIATCCKGYASKIKKLKPLLREGVSAFC